MRTYFCTLAPIVLFAAVALPAHGPQSQAYTAFIRAKAIATRVHGDTAGLEPDSRADVASRIRAELAQLGAAIDDSIALHDQIAGLRGALADAHRQPTVSSYASVTPEREPRTAIITDRSATDTRMHSA
jgi:hypothetical protein